MQQHRGDVSFVAKCLVSSSLGQDQALLGNVFIILCRLKMSFISAKFVQILAVQFLRRIKGCGSTYACSMPSC